MMQQILFPSLLLQERKIVEFQCSTLPLVRALNMTGEKLVEFLYHKMLLTYLLPMSMFTYESE